MNILINHIDDIQYHLYKAIEKGDQWMTYLHPVDQILDHQSIETWNSKSAAQRFCETNSSDRCLVIYAHIESFLQEMNKSMVQKRDKDSNSININTETVGDVTIRKQQDQQLNHFKNLSIMNDKNFDYLSNQLKYTGFGEELKEQLKEKMQKQEPQFTLTLQKDFGKDQTVATLQFRKSEESDMYFFNRYSLTLKNDQHSDPLKQTFFISNKDANITLKEAYNLLNGRAIHKELSNKEGEKYNAWLQIDFKEIDKQGNYKMRPFYEGYKYDLKATLDKHPIKEMQNETDSQRLMESLQRGNRQSVTLAINGKEQKLFIEAVPQFRSLNFYEASGQRIRTDKLYENNSQEQSAKKDTKQSTKQDATNDDSEPELGAKKTRRKRQNIT